MNKKDTSSKSSEIAIVSVALVRLNISGDVFQVPEQPLAEVSFGKMSMEVAFVLQKWCIISLAESALDASGDLLLGRDFAAPVTNDDV